MAPMLFMLLVFIPALTGLFALLIALVFVKLIDRVP